MKEQRDTTPKAGSEHFWVLYENIYHNALHSKLMLYRPLGGVDIPKAQASKSQMLQDNDNFFQPSDRCMSPLEIDHRVRTSRDASHLGFDRMNPAR